MQSIKNIRKIKKSVDALDLTTGLTDEQVEWVKGKVNQIELWKDIAAIKLDEIEQWKDAAVIKFDDLEDRVAALETKANQFQAAMISLIARVKALEDAH